MCPTAQEHEERKKFLLPATGEKKVAGKRSNKIILNGIACTTPNCAKIKILLLGRAPPAGSQKQVSYIIFP
jgi:hypothetical protein